MFTCIQLLLFSADESKPMWFASEVKTRSHIEVAAKIQLLMDEDDSRVFRNLDVGDLKWTSRDRNFPIVRLLNTGEDFHQRALAGTIFTNDGDHFTLVNGQAHIHQCPDAWKTFRDGANFQKWRGHGRVIGRQPAAS